MPSRVNVRFVVILAVALAMVFALSAGVFVYVRAKSGDRYIRLGDQAMARGEPDAADDFYSVAVNKDRTNILWLKKWREARERKTPATDTRYAEDYTMYTRGILSSLARLQRTNTEAQKDYLGALFAERAAFGGTREAWAQCLEQVGESLAGLEPEQPLEIRRYRGIGTVALLGADPQTAKETLATAEADLKAVLAADPRDVEASENLATLYQLLSARARATANSEEETSLLARARQVLDAAIAADPESPRAQVLGLRTAIMDLQRVGAGKTETEQQREQSLALGAMEPKVAELKARILKADPAKVTLPVVNHFYLLATLVDRVRGLEHAQDVAEHAGRADPDNPDLLILRGRIAAGRAKFDDAIARYEEVLKIPRKPVSLAGLRLTDLRRRAQFEQASTAVGRAALGDAAKLQEGLQQARQYRDRLAKLVPEHSPELLFIDGKIMLAGRDLRGAQAAFSDFLRAPGDVPEAIADARAMLATVALRLDPPQPGLAREQLRELLRSRPGSNEVRLQLATVEFMLENRSGAVALYREVLRSDPQNETAVKQLAVLEGTTTDPVMKVLVQADNLARGSTGSLGDDKAALAAIEAALEPNGYDPRLVAAAVRLKAGTGDITGAQQIVAKALEKHAEDDQLKAMQRGLAAGDSLESALASIEQSSGTPLQKALARVRAYGRFGKKAEADAAFDEAVRTDPDDQLVLELRFVRAIDRKDLAEAGRVAERAIQLNADRAEGDTYRARLQLAQGNYQEAAMLLERASRRGNANPAIYRMLGGVLLQLGRGPDAVLALKHAMDLNPTEVQTVKQYLVALVRTGQGHQALAVAREAETFGRRDPEFVNAWLDLEADAGNIQFARQRREELLASSPDDRGNAGALAELYMRERSWDKARATIDALSAKGRTIQTVALDARWYSGRGDTERATRVFKDYIGTLPETERGSAYLAAASFLADSGQIETALAALRQAAATQDPKTMPVDLMMGDMLLTRGRFAESEECYRRVLAAGVADPQLSIHKRLIEALIQQNKAAEAERELALLGEKGESDVDLLAQRAQMLRTMGRTREARELLDRAIARLPAEPSLYFRRARLAISDPALAGDAMADLDAAIKLSPTFWQALRARSQVYWSQKKYDEAIRDLRTALEGSPGFEELRWELVDRLLSQGREADAAAAADAGAALRPGDLRYLRASAERFARSGRWARAAGYYRQMLSQAPDEFTAALCVNAYLSSTPPALAEAEAVLSTPGLEVEKSWRLLLARAAIRKLQNNEQLMRGDLMQSSELAADIPSYVGWFEGMRRVVGKPGPALEILRSVQVRPVLADWLKVSYAVTQLDETVSNADAIAQLRSMATSAQDPGARLNAAKAANSALAQLKRWDDAVAVARDGLAADPNDFMLNNNLASILADQLARPADALPYAEKAFAAAPGSIGVIDTLASVQWAAGQKEKAVQTAALVLKVPQDDADKAKLVEKMARWKLQLGDKAGAAAALEALREVGADSPALLSDLQPRIQTLQKDIEAAR